MKNIIVYYKCAPGKRDEFLKGVRENKIWEQTHAEPGCIQYQYTVPTDDPDIVVLLEKWATEEAHQSHMQTAHLKKLQELKKEFVAETTIDLYQMV